MAVRSRLAEGLRPAATRSTSAERHLVAWMTVAVAGVVAGLLVVKLGEDGDWTHQAVVGLGGLALAAVGSLSALRFSLAASRTSASRAGSRDLRLRSR